MTRFLIIAIIAVFLVVTVCHVSDYAGSFEPAGRAWLGWPYALAVDASIVVCAMLTRHAKTRAWAWFGYATFTAASGVMNAAAIQPGSVYAWVYALFPTAAIGLLGFLARQADAVAEAQREMARLAAKAERERLAAQAEERRLREQRNARDRAARAAAKSAGIAPGIAQNTQLIAQKTATVADWRTIRAGLNGDGDHLDAARVAELVTGAGLALPSRRTVQGWARDTK